MPDLMCTALGTLSMVLFIGAKNNEMPLFLYYGWFMFGACLLTKYPALLLSWAVLSAIAPEYRD